MTTPPPKYEDPEGYSESPFGEFMGLHTLEITDEHVLAELETRPQHLNPTGAIHGGVFIALADNIGTAMANRAHMALTDEVTFMVGIDLHANMMANQPGGTIHFEARPIRVGRRVVFVRTTVTGDNGRKLAEVTTTHVPA
ncbi:MAG: PaaI family thioesterase [Dehalococcoidia bacterium]